MPCSRSSSFKAFQSVRCYYTICIRFDNIREAFLQLRVSSKYDKIASNGSQSFKLWNLEALEKCLPQSGNAIFRRERLCLYDKINEIHTSQEDVFLWRTSSRKP